MLSRRSSSRVLRCLCPFYAPVFCCAQSRSSAQRGLDFGWVNLICESPQRECNFSICRVRVPATAALAACSVGENKDSPVGAVRLPALQLYKVNFTGNTHLSTVQTVLQMLSSRVHSATESPLPCKPLRQFRQHAYQRLDSLPLRPNQTGN